MLIEKNMAPKTGDICAFRLTGGDEVIGKVVTYDPNSAITVARPIIVQMRMMGPQQAGIGFAPFMVAADEDLNITFPLDRLAMKPVKARDDIAAEYRRATTGLAIPSGPASSIIPG